MNKFGAYFSSTMAVSYHSPQQNFTIFTFTNNGCVIIYILGDPNWNSPSLPWKKRMFACKYMCVCACVYFWGLFCARVVVLFQYSIMWCSRPDFVFHSQGCSNRWDNQPIKITWLTLNTQYYYILHKKSIVTDRYLCKQVWMCFACMFIYLLCRTLRPRSTTATGKVMYRCDACA